MEQNAPTAFLAPLPPQSSRGRSTRRSSSTPSRRWRSSTPRTSSASSPSAIACTTISKSCARCAAPDARRPPARTPRWPPPPVRRCAAVPCGLTTVIATRPRRRAPPPQETDGFREKAHAEEGKARELAAREQQIKQEESVEVPRARYGGREPRALGGSGNGGLRRRAREQSGGGLRTGFAAVGDIPQMPPLLPARPVTRLCMGARGAGTRSACTPTSRRSAGTTTATMSRAGSPRPPATVSRRLSSYAAPPPPSPRLHVHVHDSDGSEHCASLRARTRPTWHAWLSRACVAWCRIRRSTRNTS
eukprot:6606004-Prymnesium_polylepis.2